MKLDGTVVCFDLDDTLVSECDYVESGLLAAGEALDAELPGPSPSGPWLVALWRRERAPDGFQRLLRERGISEEVWVPRLKQVYRSHEPALRLRDGAYELVDAIARSSGRLALVTDGHARAQRAKWRALRLPAPFHPVVFTDDMGREFWKPHPWGFELVMRAHPGSRFVYVADNPAKDFIAPNRLGWTTIMVRDVRNVHSQRFEHGAAAPGCCVDSLAAVLRVIPHS